ncbi:Npt1/Npt2 family nucleotide transporter [Desulfotignum phosphitoxidans]|jgi:ATP/ADP translocase/HEAT repeat protein|uniref:ADP,ATP carrier protein n=1 Tax=Desulfotignum phosphitoxidans DSM 13687 TaxID=1286635 RepID=S0G796_9BACT|nr:Npt1/Npt2 family nucleotide transporter [Desulfotignum phosphitoxidans]EMS80992.1 cyclic nucleotide-binding domain-containing protein [Desulfotignum phosphitoxidans DSM 13687]
MRAKLLSFLKIYEEEISLFLWTAALLFIIRSSGIILNNYAETAFLKRYGVEFMPVVNMLNAVATFFITGFLTVFLSKTSGARLLYYIFIFSGIIVTVIRLLIPFGIELLYPLLFMLKSQFELLQALLFWNMCNDLFNTRQSKRLFPLLTAGGVIGLILGSFGTPYFAGLFSLDNLLYLYLVTTIMGAILIKAMGRSYATLIYTEKTGKNAKKKPPMMEEIKRIYPLVKDSILVKIVLVLTFMPNVVIPIMNYQFNYAVNEQFASESAMIHFFGYFRGSLYIVSLFILLFVGRIYGKWGLPVALMFHPFNYMLAFFAFLFRFDVFSAMYARMSTNIIRTTINMPANSILIGLFPESYRNMIRPFLRGTVVRIALFTGSTLILLSTPLFHPRYLTLVALPFMIAWVVAPFVLKSNYSKILLDLISNNMLDIKSMDQKELGQIFNQEKTLSSLETSFLSARGKDAVWYAKLLKNFSPDRLDQLIIKNLENQDETTQVALIKMITPESGPRAAKELIPLMSLKRPETTIAILKLINQHGMDTSDYPVISELVTSKHPVIKGFAGACIHSDRSEDLQQLIADWLTEKDPASCQAGIICAGLSRSQKWIPELKDMLNIPGIDPVIPDIIIALSRLQADEINAVALHYLSHDRADVRRAALDALAIVDDDTLLKTIHLMGDPSDEIHEFAKDKIRTADHQNPRLLVESLGLPSTRIRKGLFNLLDTLDIKEFDVLIFAKKNLAKSYEYLAMAASLENLPQGPMRDLAISHLVERKELILENIVRVLAIHDQTGRMRTAWQGIFSADARQRANAIELLNDILDRKTFNTMLPLLESPNTTVALADGRKLVKIPGFSSDGKQAASELLSSPDWVDVILGLGLIGEIHDLQPASDCIQDLEQSENPYISKEVHMILQKKKSTQDTEVSAKLSLGEKILLLKEIDIFSGLTASELAAISSVTEETEFAEDQEVIKQNSIGETVYLIIEGRVSVIMEKENGNQAEIDQMDSGAAFGEMALIDNSPRSATIRTITPCRFLTLHKQEFKETAMEFPRIALQICSVLSQRIRHLHSLVQEKQ